MNMCENHEYSISRRLRTAPAGGAEAEGEAGEAAAATTIIVSRLIK